MKAGETKKASAADALRAKSAADLNTELFSLRKEQFALRLQRATGGTAKPDQFGKVRRNIARLKTVQREQRGKSGGK
jgi:large subunit ribosomal protein L29